MCTIVMDLAKFYTEHTGCKVKFSDEEIQMMRDVIINEEEDDDVSITYAWVDTVFGADAKLEEDEFRKKCGDKMNTWLFEPDMLRKKLANKAGLDEKKW